MTLFFDPQNNKEENRLISVIVPAYNIESYLAKTLDSILAQTYTNLEIILVNDGSTDKTGEIVDIYAAKDSRIVVIHKENEGVSVARNAGIDQACGDYIGFIDGDDTIEPDMFAFLLDNATKHGADISHCGHTMLTDKGDIPHYGTGTVKLQDTVAGVLDLLEGTLVDPGLWTKIYKRELFSEVRLEPGLRINEDLLINYYLFKRSRCSIFTDISKYNYIKRPGSTTTSVMASYKVVDLLRVAKEIMEDAASHPELSILAEYRFLMTLLNICRELVMTNNPAMTEVKDEVLEELLSYRKRFLKNDLVSRKYCLFVELILRIPLAFKLINKMYCVILGR